MEYTVSKLAMLSGVSARTLRYYDQIDLLKPSRINSSGYRIYGQPKVDLLQQILFYRELEMPLEEIKSILQSDNFDIHEALESHLVNLNNQRKRLDRLIQTVENTIQAKEGGPEMSEQEKFEAFKKERIAENEDKFGKEIRKEYGNAVVEQANKRLRNTTAFQMANYKALNDELDRKLAEATKLGDPSSGLAQEVCELHHEWIAAAWPEGHYDKEKHYNLSVMYVEDERFRAYYDKIEPSEEQNGILTTEEELIEQDKQLKAINAKIAHTAKRNKGEDLEFTFTYMENIKKLFEILQQNKCTKGTYMGYLLQLQTYLTFDNELIDDKTDKPLNRTGIGKVLKVSDRKQSRKFINLMIDEGLLKEVKGENGKYFEMNNRYSFRGRTRSKKVAKIFNKSIRSVYKDNLPADVAFLYLLIPYVSLEENVLAHNPYEQNPSKLDVLINKDIAQLTGVSIDTVYRKKDRMIFNGLYVFKTETKGAKTNYVINPLVFYRHHGEPHESIVRSFMIKGK